MARSPDPGHVSPKLEERRAKGAEWRGQVPFAALAEWKPPATRADPIEMLIEQGKSRIQELLPVRYKRMKCDAFAFMRGAAAIMAACVMSRGAVSLGARAANGMARRMPRPASTNVIPSESRDGRQAPRPTIGGPVAS